MTRVRTTNGICIIGDNVCPNAEITVRVTADSQLIVRKETQNEH